MPTQRPLLFADAEAGQRSLESKSTSELITILSTSTSTFSARVGAAEALAKRPEQAVPAVPALIANLRNRDTYVTIAVAKALGSIGPPAAAAAPELIRLFQHSSYTNERVQAIYALQKIKNKIAVPILIDALANKTISSEAAEAIETIVGAHFPHYKDTGTTSSSVDEKGEWIIVLSARTWWQEHGSKIDWSR